MSTRLHAPWRRRQRDGQNVTTWHGEREMEKAEFSRLNFFRHTCRARPAADPRVSNRFARFHVKIAIRLWSRREDRARI